MRAGERGESQCTKRIKEQFTFRERKFREKAVNDRVTPRYVLAPEMFPPSTIIARKEPEIQA